MSEVAGELRFGMLETIREFGVEQFVASGEEAVLRDAHAASFLGLAERAEPELVGPNQTAWVARLEADLGNIRTALGWMRQRDQVEDALRLAGAIGWFWSSPGYFHEGRDLFAALIAMAGADDHPAPLAKAISTAGDIADWLGDSDQARRFYERAIEIYRALGDNRRVAGMLRGLGSIAIDQRDIERATLLLEDALALARASGDAWEVAAAANLLGGVAAAVGDWEVALARHEEAIGEWGALDDLGHVVTAQASLALTALAGGFCERARAAYRQVLTLATVADDRWHLVRALAGFGALASVRGEPERSARLLAAASVHSAAIGAPLRPVAQATFDRFTAEVRAALGESAFAVAGEAGRTLSFDDALAEARAEATETDESPPPSPPAGRTSNLDLTEREIEVLRLIATGRTDQEIADRLSIARRTASKHVSAILSKLGVRTRRAAVQAASDLDLV
jgi:DNA-binding CsgD family transcriptional regulator/tetratricopeptide (TPR) repeat protein